MIVDEAIWIEVVGRSRGRMRATRRELEAVGRKLEDVATRGD
jgi:hypothetical protein